MMENFEKSLSSCPVISIRNDFVKTFGYDFSLRENNFFILIASKIKKEDTCDTIYTVTVKEYMETFGIKDKGIYEEIREITKKLTRECFTVISEKDKVLEKTIIPCLSYVKIISNGIISFKFNSYLSPYFFELKKYFHQIAVDELAKLNTSFAQRIFQGLVSNFKYLSGGRENYTASWEESVEDIKRSLQKEYLPTGKLNREIINPSIKRINEKTNYDVKCKPIKENREIKKYHMRVSEKINSQSYTASQQEILSNHLFEELIATGLSKKDATSTLKNYDDVMIKEALKVTQERKAANEIKTTPKAYFKTVLDNIKHQSEMDNTTVKIPSPEELNLTFEGEFNDCLKTLADSITHSSYKSWFSDVRFNLTNNILYVICPMKLSADRVESSYKAEIFNAWNHNEYKVDTIEVSIG